MLLFDSKLMIALDHFLEEHLGASSHLTFVYLKNSTRRRLSAAPIETKPVITIGHL